MGSKLGSIVALLLFLCSKKFCTYYLSEIFGHYRLSNDLPISKGIMIR